MKKILIIDDEPLVRRSLRRVLTGAGFDVSEAADGNAGLGTWLKEGPDLVFLDILMPGLTGPQVLMEVDSQVRARCRVILMSAYSGDYSIDSAKGLGADHFIAKPFEDIFAIVKAVQEMLK